MKPQQKDTLTSELIEKVKALKDRQPYSWLIESEDITVRHAGENALLGWVGALACVLVILEADVKEKPQFKVGDKVEIVAVNASGIDAINIGRKGVIEEIDPDAFLGLPYLVDCDTANFWLADSEIALKGEDGV